MSRNPSNVSYIPPKKVRRVRRLTTIDDSNFRSVKTLSTTSAAFKTYPVNAKEYFKCKMDPTAVVMKGERMNPLDDRFRLPSASATTTITTTSPATFTTNPVTSSIYLKDKTENKQVPPLREEDIDDLENRYKAAKLSLIGDANRTKIRRLDDKIVSVDYYISQLRKQNNSRNISQETSEMIQENFKFVRDAIEEIEKTVENNNPIYWNNGVRLKFLPGMKNELAAIEKRFLLAKEALKNRKPETISKLENYTYYIAAILKLISDNDLLNGRNTSRSTEELREEIELELKELQKDLKKFEDAIENNDFSEDEVDP